MTGPSSCFQQGNVIIILWLCVSCQNIRQTLHISLCYVVAERPEIVVTTLLDGCVQHGQYESVHLCLLASSSIMLSPHHSPNHLHNSNMSHLLYKRYDTLLLVCVVRVVVSVYCTSQRTIPQHTHGCVRHSTLLSLPITCMVQYRTLIHSTKISQFVYSVQSQHLISTVSC